MEEGKMVSFWKDDFTEEVWETLCDEFEVNSDEEYFSCVVDLATKC